jgi:hypothetical protein
VDIVSSPHWPEALLGDVARLKVLARGLPGTSVAERVLDAPFERAWAWIADLERSVPLFDGDVEALEVRRRDGNRLRVVATAPWWLGHSRVGFYVELRPGWCWMVARNGLYVVGMAVEREGERTRIAHLEGVAVRGSTWKRRLAAPVLVLRPVAASLPPRARPRRHRARRCAEQLTFAGLEIVTCAWFS